jgi:hypothetical protein
MSLDFACPECSRQLRIGDQFAGKKVLCPSCRKVVTAPSGAVSVTPNADLIIPLLEPDAPPPGTPAPMQVVPIDNQPATPADAGDCCPGCGRFLAPAAVVCLDCGYNRKTGKQHRTVSRRRERTWYLGGFTSPPVILVVAALALFLVVVAFLSENRAAGIIWLAFGLIPMVLLLGSFTRIRITRDPDGRPVVIRDRWVAFLHFSHKEIDLEGYDMIRLGHQERAGDPMLMGLLVCTILCGLIPGILFWLLLFRSSTFTLEIAGEHVDGVPPLVEPEALYRGPSEVKMRDIGDTLKQFAGMHYG